MSITAIKKESFKIRESTYLYSEQQIKELMEKTYGFYTSDLIKFKPSIESRIPNTRYYFLFYRNRDICLCKVLCKGKLDREQLIKIWRNTIPKDFAYG